MILFVINIRYLKFLCFVSVLWPWYDIFWLCLIQKWSDYKLLNVTLELHEAAVYKKSDHRNKSINENEEKDDKIFVAFKMDDIPERRPFLLSRDLVSARPTGSNIEPFQVSFLDFHCHLLKLVILFIYSTQTCLVHHFENHVVLLIPYYIWW